jgi:YHS domain-containing protein
LIRLIIFIIVVYFAYRGFRSWMRQQFGADQTVSTESHPEIDDEMVQDPYCKTYVPKRDGLRTRVGGEVLYFCSETCRDRYIDESTARQ